MLAITRMQKLARVGHLELYDTLQLRTTIIINANFMEMVNYHVIAGNLFNITSPSWTSRQSDTASFIITIDNNSLSVFYQVLNNLNFWKGSAP
jgi:hypothetical protein